MFIYQTEEYLKQIKNENNMIQQKALNEERKKEIKKYDDYLNAVSTFISSMTSIKQNRLGQNKSTTMIEVMEFTQSEEIKDMACAYLLKHFDFEIGNEESSISEFPVEVKNRFIKSKENILYIFKKIKSDKDKNLMFDKSEAYMIHLASELVNEFDNARALKVQNLNLTVLAMASSFEILIANLIKFELIYVVKKGGKYIADLKKSYNDIAEYTSVVELKKEFVDKYVNEEMYGDFKNWIDTASEILINKKRFLDDNDSLISAIEEMFQRRNIIVHNNNLVTKKYNLRTNNRETLNKPLKIDEIYVENQLMNLTKLASKLIMGNIRRRKLYKEPVVFKAMNNIGLRIINRRMPELSKDIFNGLLDFEYNSYITEHIKVSKRDFMLLCNIWLADYSAGNKELVKNEVNKIIVSPSISDHAQDKQYQMAMAILTDDITAVDKTLEFLKGFKRDIQTEIVATWPIFNLLQEKTKFIDYRKRLYYSE